MHIFFGTPYIDEKSHSVRSESYRLAKDFSKEGVLTGLYGAISSCKIGKKVLESIVDYQMIFEPSFIGQKEQILVRRIDGTFKIQDETAYFLDEEVLIESLSYSSDINKIVVDSTCFLHNKQATVVTQAISEVEGQPKKILILNEPVPMALDYFNFFDIVSIDLRIFDTLLYSEKPIEIAKEKSIDFVITSLEDWRMYTKKGDIITGRSYDAFFDIIKNY